MADEPKNKAALGLPTLKTPTLTKAELAELLFERLGPEQARVQGHGRSVLRDHPRHPGVGGGRQDVRLRQFQYSPQGPAPGRNPRTGEAIPIKARNVVTFHASHKLKGVVQGDIPPGEEFE
jgi:integration host factor subunit alpha